MQQVVCAASYEPLAYQHVFIVDVLSNVCSVVPRISCVLVRVVCCLLLCFKT
jgi:hypothetical protein